MKVENLEIKVNDLDTVYSVEFEGCDGFEGCFTTFEEAKNNADDCVVLGEVFVMRYVWCDDCERYEPANSHDLSIDATEYIRPSKK